MALGLIAVFAAIVYKVGEAGKPRPLAARAEPVAADIAVPPGARLVSTALDGERALLTMETPDGAASLVLVDLASGRVLGRYAIVGK